MQTIKGRSLEVGQEVFVYFNLHKKVFSIKDVKTGLVVAHTQRVVLEECTFKVSEAGRQRVLKEKRKNVHAGVRGKILDETVEFIQDSIFENATYNPYKYDSFVDKETGEKLKTADLVILDNKKVKYL